MRMLEPLFKIKICGVTSVDGARMIADSGADAIGLNFYPESPRYVTLQHAEKIVTSAPQVLKKVGVFVNSSPDYVDETVNKLGLDAVQLHGDETIEMVAALNSPSIIRAFRCHDGGLKEIEQALQAFHQSQVELAGILLDAHVPGQYGGTGTMVDWNQIHATEGRLFGIPLILAGGLRFDNVGQAIATVRPAAVDTASGVEIEPGIKDASQVSRFVEAARKAFQRQ